MKRIELVTPDDLERRLAESLAQGQMPDPFLYIGNGGARNWLTLDSSDEFPVAVRLQHLLEESLPDMLDCIAGVGHVVSLGVGRGEKERILLEALLGKGLPRYIAVDISASMVETALDTSAGVDVEKLGLVGFVEDLPVIRSYWEPPVLLCLLGNNFCNYHPDSLLELVREQLGPQDLFMFDCHLLPQSGSGQEQVENTYRSRQNVLFNIGPLVDRGMEPDACRFNLDLIEQETSGGKVCRTCKWLDITRDSTVCCGSSNVHLDAGARVELGFTYKYTREQVLDCLQRQGFDPLHTFVSSDGDNLLALARRDNAVEVA